MPSLVERLKRMSLYEDGNMYTTGTSDCTLNSTGIFDRSRAVSILGCRCFRCSSSADESLLWLPGDGLWGLSFLDVGGDAKIGLSPVGLHLSTSNTVAR